MGVAFVTGASRGIGRAIAVELGRAGFSVACGGRARDALEATAEAVRAAGADAVVVELDVTELASCEAAVAHAQAGLGPIDVLVNNAGIGGGGEIEAMAPELWDRVLATNLTGVFSMTRTVIGGMKERGSGHIVNIASVAGHRGFAGGAAYAASKFGVVGFSESLMLEVRRHGVRVTVVSPGSVDTEFFPPEKAREGMLAPEDVARAVRFAVEMPPRALVDHVMLRPLIPPK